MVIMVRRPGSVNPRDGYPVGGPEEIEPARRRSSYLGLQAESIGGRSDFLHAPVARQHFIGNRHQSCPLQFIDIALHRTAVPMQTFRNLSKQGWVYAANLFVLFKHSALDAGWLRHQVTTVRWRLFHLPGKVVRHAGTWVLKVATEAVDLFRSIRARSFVLAQAMSP